MQDQLFDRTYFSSRLEQNRALAERSDNPAIRTIHLEYARLYAQLLDEASTEMAD
jgi:hypothetical protein